MKRGRINTFAMLTLLVGTMLCMNSCKEPEVENTPNFPEKISATVSAGDIYEFTITPNMAWTLKIPTDVASFFKFIVGESERYTLNGAAGTHTISVAVSATEEFDKVRVCEISMTMGGESQVVAELTRGAKERTLNIFAAEFNATDEAFATDEEGNWIYSSTPADRLDWVWCNEQWMQRVAVEADFKWSLAPDTPAWLNTNKNNGKEGKTELFLRINREQLPLEDVTCDIEFCSINDNNGDGVVDEDDIIVVKSYQTSIEGCKDVCEVEVSAALTFNGEGDYHQTTSSSYSDYATARIYSPRGAEIVALNKGADGSYSTEGAEWILLTIDEFPEEAGDYGVWERVMHIDTEANPNQEVREGAIAAIPRSIAKGGNYNPADYVVCTIKQEFTVVIDNNEAIYAYDKSIMEAYNALFESMTAGTFPYDGEWQNIPYGYHLIYNSNYSSSDLVFNKPFARYEIYGFEGYDGAQYEAGNCWLTIEPSEEYLNIENGYIIKSHLGDKIDGEVVTNTLAGPNGENEASIVFYNDNDEAYALIYFVLDPTYHTPAEKPEGEITFANSSYAANGATIAPLDELDDDYSYELQSSLQYRLTLNPACKEVVLNVPEYLMTYSYQSWLNASDTSATTITISIDTDSLPAAGADENGNITHKGITTVYGFNNYNILIQLHVVYKES